MIFTCINKFYDFFIIFSIGILLNDFFERKYSNKYNIIHQYIMNFFANILYNSIYYYSKCQIYFFKYIQTNILYLKIVETFKKKIIDTKQHGFEILFIKDNNLSYNMPNDLPDFIIASDLSKNPVVKKIITNTDNYNDVIFEETDIKFILIEFIIGENIFKIDLKTNTYNYYMIGNKFTKKFFMYYIKTYLNIKNNFNDNNTYKLKIIDDSVNTIEIDFTDKDEGILLEKNEYKLTITSHCNNE